MNMTEEQALFLKDEIESSMPGYHARANKHQYSDSYMELYPNISREYWLVGVYASDFILADIVMCFASLNDWTMFKNAACCFVKNMQDEVMEDQINEQARLEARLHDYRDIMFHHTTDCNCPDCAGTSEDKEAETLLQQLMESGD